MNGEFNRRVTLKKILLILPVAATCLAYIGCPGNANENDKNQKEAEKQASSSTGKKDKESKKTIEITPAASMSSNSPAFQSPLTKLIRTKGHADQALKKGDFKRAKKLYLRCVKDPKVNHRSLGFCYKNLAQIYDKEGSKPEAEKYYKLAIEEMKKHKMKRQVEPLQKKLLKLNNSKQSD